MATPNSQSDPIPTEGRLLGVDYGSKRIGLSISNPEQTIASPIENYTRGDRTQDARKFKQVLVDYTVAGVLVGLPVHVDGGESRLSGEARAFAAWLREQVSVPIGFADERFSSTLADDILAQAELTSKRRKARRDMLASQIMLQHYLDGQRDRRLEDLTER